MIPLDDFLRRLFRSGAARFAAVAATYTLLGKLGLLLAIPPSYATPVFPSAGIALAALLLWGNRYAAAVWIGSFALNMWVPWSRGSVSALQIAIAASLAVWAGGQALLGAALIRRYVGFPAELHAPRAILLFLALGAPIGCLVSATFGTLTLLAGGLLTTSELSFSWWTWWVGDSIGVLTFAPIALIAVASRELTWWRRRYSVAVPLILAFAFEIVVFIFVSRTDRARQRQEFDGYATVATGALRQATEWAAEVPVALRDLFDASGHVSAKEFSVFARRYLERRPTLRGVGWMPIVTDAERRAFEARMSVEEGRPFRISDRAADGSMRDAPRREEYFPLRYLENDDGTSASLSFDIAGESLRLEAVERARRSGTIALSRRIAYSGTDGERYGVMFVVPVLAADAGDAGADSLGSGAPPVRGFTVGVLDLAKAGAHAIASINRPDVTMTIEDASALESDRLLFSTHGPQHGEPRSRKDEPLATMSTLQLGGRTWTVRITSTPAYMAAHRSLQAWATLAGGLILTAGLGAFLLVLTGRAARVESLVAVRTRELTLSNDWLRREIEERGRVEVDLRVAIEAAASASRAKSEFLANMSHEIRTPMNGIVGMTGLLDTTSLTAQQRECTGTIRQSADALLLVINDILDFSKIESGHVEFESADFDVDATVDDVLDTVALQATQKGIQLVGHVEPSVPRLVRGDAGRVRQILTNLVGNAVKFTAEGGVTVRVSIDAEDAASITLRFVVTDTGIGIPHHAIDSLFSPFTQADATTTRRFGGTGLGLSISRELARRMGGDVIARSQPARGSTFSFDVKLRHAVSPARHLDAPSILPGSHVVVAHHSAAVRERLVALIESWHASVREVHDLGQLRTLCSDPTVARPTLVLVESRLAGDEARLSPDRIRAELGVPYLVLLSPIAERLRGAATVPESAHAFVSEPVRRDRLREALERLAPTFVQPGSVTEAAPARAAAAQILIVEDNAINQLVAARMLERLGHVVRLAANGREALEQLEAEEYDLVIMDCHMPEMDGYEATRAIRDPASAVRRHDTPIVAMTANAGAADRQRCLDAGMNDFLSKPVTLEAMTDVVARWVVKPAALQPEEGRDPVAQGSGAS